MVFGFCPAGSTFKVDLTFGKRLGVLEANAVGIVH